MNCVVIGVVFLTIVRQGKIVQSIQKPHLAKHVRGFLYLLIELHHFAVVGVVGPALCSSPRPHFFEKDTRRWKYTPELIDGILQKGTEFGGRTGKRWIVDVPCTLAQYEVRARSEPLSHLVIGGRKMTQDVLVPDRCILVEVAFVQVDMLVHVILMTMAPRTRRVDRELTRQGISRETKGRIDGEGWHLTSVGDMRGPMPHA